MPNRDILTFFTAPNAAAGLYLNALHIYLSIPAIRFLKKEKVAFTGHLYNYEEHGGTVASARELGVAEHSVIKTLVMEDENKKPLIADLYG
ncbi:MAG: hypothetical protein A4E53_04019 [Pelotomaculum sp. PtaB.Bin104]|nr:MAG: hypothetical protein A4E53_04019 [Pelotomaculum sp. PtaB.Bin104]